jgi:hypothetical protein
MSQPRCATNHHALRHREPFAKGVEGGGAFADVSDDMAIGADKEMSLLVFSVQMLDCCQQINKTKIQQK